MPEHDWSWNAGTVRQRLALEPQAIGTDEPGSPFDVPEQLLRTVAEEYGLLLQAELSPLDQTTFWGDCQPRVASRQGSRPIVPTQRAALELLELKHSHPGATYFADGAESQTEPDVYEIPSLRPDGGTVLATPMDKLNEPMEKFYERTIGGREFHTVNFEKETAVSEVLASIDELIQAAPVDVETTTSGRGPVEVRDDGLSVTIPRQQRRYGQTHRSNALYAVCLAKARQESGTRPSTRVQVTHTLAAAWTVRMAFAGAYLGQWPTAPAALLRTAGQYVQQDPSLMAAALDLNHRLEQSLITRRMQVSETPLTGQTGLETRRPSVTRTSPDPDDVSADAEPAPPPRTHPDFRRDPVADRDDDNSIRR